MATKSQQEPVSGVHRGPTMNSQTGHYEKAIHELQRLFKEASRRGIAEPDTAAFATSDKTGFPTVRMVYILAIELRGPVIFINMLSGKGLQIQDNPQASICFFWPELQHQVILEGTVDVLSETDSDLYWRKRPRDSQLGAWASEQSEKLQDKEHLKKNLATFKKLFDYKPADRPKNWRAIQVRPTRIEFWKTGWNRLAARTRYHALPDGNWTESIQNP